MPAKTAKNSQAEYKGKITTDNKGGNWLSGGISPVGKIIYPACFQPARTYSGYLKQQKGHTITDDDQEYKVTLLIDKNDSMLKSMEKAVNDFAKSEHGLKKGETFTNPIKDGNEKFKQDPEKFKYYKNVKYLDLKIPATKIAPNVFDENGNEMMNQNDLYSGCYCVCMISFKAYNVNGNRGVKVYWQAIKKIADGEKLFGDRDSVIEKNMDNGTVNIKMVNGVAVYS